jgi:DNA repair exonuclease SbcCD ATPase subunit
MSKTTQTLEDELKPLTPKVAAAKTTLSTLRVSEANLKDSTAQARSENIQLEESCKQLLQEAAVWKEQVSHLNKHKVTLEEPATSAARILKDKDDHLRWLTEGIRKLKVWAFVLEEHGTHDGDLDTATNPSPENPAHLDTQTKGALQHLMFAVTLNASLKSLVRERDQVYTELREVERASKDLTERIKNVQSEQVILQSQHAQLEIEKEKLRHTATIIPEVFEEGLKFYRKLMVEDHRQRDTEEKLPKVKENISRKTAQLQTYKKVARELEEKLERTKLNHQREIISYEKKAHFNWLEAQDAEEQLQYLRQVNANSRQKLMEMELELKLLEEDPNAFGVSNAACGREHFPRGPSPVAQPSCERRVFLSPIVLEGPLRPPPLLQQGGGKDSRSPDNPLEHHTGKERGDSSCDGLTGHRGAPPENGSLCPPRKQEERVMVPPSGQPLTDPAPPAHNSNVPVESKVVGPVLFLHSEVPCTQ